MDLTVENLLQAPVVSSQKKKVCCETCGKDFANKSNLNRHVATDHIDQTTTEAISKRLERNTYCNTRRRKRSANDPLYREKEKQISRTNRIKKKARNASGGDGSGVDSNDVEAKDVSISSIDLIEVLDEDGVGVGAVRNHVQTKDTSVSVEVSKVPQSAGMLVKKPNEKAKTMNGPHHAKTMPLTTANVNSFFEPKYAAARSKAERLAAPRSSVI